MMGNGEGPGFGRDLRGYTGYGDTQGFDSVRVLVLEMWLLVDVWPLEPGTGLMGNGEGPGFGRDL